jgi:hypothetical protein
MHNVLFYKYICVFDVYFFGFIQIKMKCAFVMYEETCRVCLCMLQFHLVLCGGLSAESVIFTYMDVPVFLRPNQVAGLNGIIFLPGMK